MRSGVVFLQDVARRPRLHGVHEHPLLGVGGEDEHARFGELRLDPPRGLYAVQNGHRDVHEHEVGLELSAAGLGLQSVLGLSDYHQCVVVSQGGTHCYPHQGVIVYE
jgi:hypothetical protein